MNNIDISNLNIDTSNLVDQLIEMSDLSALSKFLIFHSNLLTGFTCISLLLLLVMMLACAEEKTKNLPLIKTTIFFAILSTILTILTTVKISQSNDLRQADLSKDQIALVKSIPSPIFQDFVKDSIQARGATISAIDVAVDNFEFKYSNIEKRIRGVELYHSVDPK